MALVQWGPDLEVGVALIDRQHRELFDRVNKLISACGEGRGKEEACRLLDFLESYVVYHFEAEEALQREAGFPAAEAHKRLHDSFRTSLADLRKKLEAEGPSRSMVLVVQSAVVDWLIKHIGVQDRAIGRYLVEAGGPKNGSPVSR